MALFDELLDGRADEPKGKSSTGRFLGTATRSGRVVSAQRRAVMPTVPEMIMIALVGAPKPQTLNRA